MNRRLHLGFNFSVHTLFGFGSSTVFKCGGIILEIVLLGMLSCCAVDSCVILASFSCSIANFSSLETFCERSGLPMSSSLLGYAAIPLYFSLNLHSKLFSFFGYSSVR